ncbi:MAG TPA: glutamine synthetase family protein [Terriglobales bacterium]|nr:glutamine synthetase family protein [Terriglobales bacterium]
MSDEHNAGSRGAGQTVPKQLEELRQMVRDGRIDTVIVALTDMQGRLMGKRVQAEAFLKGVVDHGIHFCTYLLGTDMEMNTPDGFKLMNWETGYGDWIGRQDWETTRVLPWLEGTAIVLCDAVDADGHEIPISPRTTLKRQVERAAGMGYTVKAGTEFEFYVLSDTFEDLAEKGYNDIERVGYYNEDYHILQATKLEPLYRQIRNQMTAARIPIEFSKGEAAPSQHEVNIRYDEVLEAADRSVLFKHGAKEIAWLNGYGLTFMAKPYADWTGSSGHLHISLWGSRGDKALFFDEERAQPYGMSDTMRWFLGGMMALQRELALFIAPNINSYKRYAVASWAPVNVVWGRDNRTTGFRIVGDGAGMHIENRFPGGDMNAYLAYAAEVGAGLYGIEHKVEPPAEYLGNGYEAKGCDSMPRALYEAVDLLESSKAAVEIFGQDVVDHYLNAARVERDAYDAAVHAWDRERYLERG